MTILKHTLMTTAAVLALAAGPAFAQSTDSEPGILLDDNGGQVDSGTQAQVEPDAVGEDEMNEPAPDPDLSQDSDGASDPLAPADGEPALAQDAPPTPMGPATESFADVTIADIIGMNVLSEDGSDIGEIDAIVEDNGTAKAVVGMGGFLGIGEHDVLIDISALQAVDDSTVMVEGQSEAELEAMPDVDVDSYTEIDGEMTLGQAVNS
ncbi:PRC-barrel domain-containing protein [Celeribacter indicus]|uniref:PRC-barrel domain-containing protein n=1 Tax=Celeribacter indicus TaxID=1208324 RepID=A0A0B5DXL8_9RHOB|nr:PRC-barrel domain-containing protein [Celeribacter indicus]AJE47734.1 hypothetical protein P73_3019 [Celeribacter indicus]SDW21296.1 PRC-barrel domain-containing protein [Celeribacter indicus]